MSNSVYYFRPLTVINNRKCWPIYDSQTGKLYGFLLAEINMMSWEEARNKQTRFWHLTLNLHLFEAIVDFLNKKGMIGLGDNIWKSNGRVFNNVFEPSIEGCENIHGIFAFAVFIHKYEVVKLIHRMYYFKDQTIMLDRKCWPIYSTKTGCLIGYLLCDVKETSITEARQSEYWRLTNDQLLLESIIDFLASKRLMNEGDNVWRSDGEVFNNLFSVDQKFEKSHDNYAVFVHMTPNFYPKK